MSGAGDVDSDGYDDVIVGAYGNDDSDTYSGAVYVYLGSTSGIDSSTEVKLNALDGAMEDFFGYSVSGAGDVNGDGNDDVIVGTYASCNNCGDGQFGAAYVFHGSCEDASCDDTGGQHSGKDGCGGCASGGAPAGGAWLFMLALVGLGARRRIAPPIAPDDTEPPASA